MAIGRIAGAYGVRGDLKVAPESHFPERFRHLRRVYLGEDRKPHNVRRVRRQGTRILLRVQGVDSREEAAARRGHYVYLPESEAISLPPGEYFVHQIVGLQVETDAGEALGTVREVLTTGGNDVYVVSGSRGEVLIPALRSVIQMVDLDKGRMVITPLPGLLDATRRGSSIVG